MRPTPFIVQKPTPGTSRRACCLVGAHQTRVRRPASPDHRGVSCHPARLPHTSPPGPDSVGPSCAKYHCLAGALPGHTPRLHATGTDGCTSTYVSGTLSVGEA